MRLNFLVAALVLLAGCTDGAGPASGGLQVSNVRPVIRMENRSGATIHTFVVESRTLTIIDWLPCTDPLRCPGISAGRDSTMLYSKIVGYEPDAEEAVLYWWHLVPGQGTALRPDSIRIVRIDL